MKLFRKIIDERQELEAMKITGTGFWILFFGLMLAIILQLFFFEFDIRYILGELVVL